MWLGFVRITASACKCPSSNARLLLLSAYNWKQRLEMPSIWTRIVFAYTIWEAILKESHISVQRNP